MMLLLIRKRSFSHLTVSNIIYEDNHVIIMNKPSHVLSQGDYSNDINIVDWLKGYLARKYDKKGNVYVGLIHRLDKGASGLLITTKTSKAASRLHDDMIGKRVNKKYLCIVHGHLFGSGKCVDLLQKTDHAMKVYQSPSSLSSRYSYTSTATTTSIDEDQDTTDKGIKLVEAKLTYKSLLNFSIDHHHRNEKDHHYHHAIESHRTGEESTVGPMATATAGTEGKIKSDYSVVEVVLDTGRKHQIRTQLSHLGHPIYGDIKYGGRYHIHQGREMDSSSSSSSSSSSPSSSPPSSSSSSSSMGIALHAYSLAFTHPVTKVALMFLSEIPNNWKLHFHPDIVNKIDIHIHMHH